MAPARQGFLKRAADRLSDELLVTFTADEYVRHPEACVRELVEAGVIYVEDGSYLTLPVSEHRRPQQADWINFRVPGIGDRPRRLAQTVRSQLVDWRELALHRLSRQS